MGGGSGHAPWIEHHRDPAGASARLAFAAASFFCKMGIEMPTQSPVGRRHSVSASREVEPVTAEETPALHFAKRAIDWGVSNGRSAPWRGAARAYEIAVAEILLQKTKAAQAAPVWRAVTREYPTPESLRDAPEGELEASVAALGLGRQRAQRLRHMAAALASGASPLPGLGPYGSAILSLAMGSSPSHVPVDGNIARVVTRLFGWSFEKGEARKSRAVRAAVHDWLVAAGSPALQLRLVYALVDLGALVCTPRRPACSSCPLEANCASSGTGSA